MSDETTPCLSDRHSVGGKERLLREWLASAHPQEVPLAGAGRPIDRAAFLDRLSTLLGSGKSVLGYVYVLTVSDDAIPVYVGKTDDPRSRWDRHIRALEAGRRTYARWRELLLDREGNAIRPITLLVIPVTGRTVAPIPGFPATPGAIEYQLVSLAGDAYPGWLLNHEGHRR